MNSLENKIKQAYDLHAQNKLDEAENFYLDILKKYPSDSNALALFGTLLLQLNRFNESISYLTQSIQFNPNLFIAHHNLGVLYSKNEVFNLALINFNNSLKLNKNYQHTYREKGWALSMLGKYEEAIESYNEALKINSNDALTYTNLSLLFYSQLQYEAALKNILRAIELNGKSSYYLQIQGFIYLEMKNYTKSVETFESALELYRNNYQVYLGLLRTNIELDNYVEAEKIREKIILECSGKDNADSHLLIEAMKNCNWEGVYEKLLKEDYPNNAEMHPFYFGALNNDPINIKKVTENYIDKNFGLSNRNNRIIKKNCKEKKIVVGYFSNDFYNHATSLLLSEAIKNHNHKDFYIIAFSYSSIIKFDSKTQELLKYFDQFIDINQKEDYEAAEIAKKYNLDIAVDLKGLTLGARPGIFSYSVAPVQVNFLGYPGTVAAPWMDYIIADKNIIDKNNYVNYTEKIIFMPECYQPNKSISPLKKLFKRKDFNLEEDMFVYCCFNDAYKITPEIFKAWMEILNKVEKSVLWLLGTNKSVIYHLKKEAKKHGVNDNRIIFSEKLSWEDHIERVSLADLFLDTFPYNAHTTASDSLRAEVPLLTLCSESFASRVGLSLLKTLKLDELITYDIETYKKRAILFAENKELYRTIKNKLMNNIHSSILFKPELFIKDLELAFKETVNRFQRGIKPEHIFL